MTPWPEAGTGDVLFIIDAAHRTEENLLRDWLASTRRQSQFSGRAREVIVPIARNPEEIPLGGLDAALTDDLAPDTLIVPVRVVWQLPTEGRNSTPRLIDLIRGDPRQPGEGRAARLLAQDPDRAVCMAAEPATLDALRARLAAREGGPGDHEALVEFIAGQAALALDIAERRSSGTRYKVPRRVARNLLSSPRLKVAIKAISGQSGRTVADLSEEAGEIMRELIATPRAFWQDLLAAFNRRFIALGYDGDFVVDPEGLERFTKTVRENPSAILWTHKTHVDGFAMYSVMFENDCPTPHLMGGVNMAFAGLGYVGRRAGAIFIRRSFQDDPLYKTVLRHYIGYLLEKHFPLTWSFEGTRSRVGKLMPPKYGILKYVLEAAHATDTRNLHILPVAISYDLIGDVSDYTREQSGIAKRPESLGWFLGYLRGLRKPLGQIYIDFGEPVVLERTPSVDDPLTVAKIAFQVGVEVNRVTPITLASLVTMVLLGAAPRALTQRELGKEMIRLLNWARERGIRVTSALEPGNTEQLNALAEALDANGLVTRFDEGPDIVYVLAPKQHAIASYYRNTTIHHFVNKAIAEVALVNVSGQSGDGEALFWEEAERLRDLFKFEFFYGPTEEFRNALDGELQRYDPDWAVRLAGDPATAGELLKTFRPLVAHATLLSFVEAYRVVANVLARLGEDESIDEKECVSRSMSYGRQAHLQRRISSEASIGKLLFQNGYRLAAKMGLTEADEGSTGLAERRNELSLDFRNLARRLDHIRTLALPSVMED